MPDKAPNPWQNAASQVLNQRTTAETIGKHLRSSFDPVLTEPLPDAISNLLLELQRRLACDDNGH